MDCKTCRFGSYFGRGIPQLCKIKQYRVSCSNINFFLISNYSHFQNGIFTPSLLTLICIYGYSLGIYIPVSVLWVIQISFLQWMLVFGAALSTGAVLIIILSPALKNSNKSIFLIGGILIAHFLLAAGFMLHFFHMPATPTAIANHWKNNSLMWCLRIVYLVLFNKDTYSI